MMVHAGFPQEYVKWLLSNSLQEHINQIQIFETFQVSALHITSFTTHYFVIIEDTTEDSICLSPSESHIMHNRT